MWWVFNRRGEIVVDRRDHFAVHEYDVLLTIVNHSESAFGGAIRTRQGSTQLLLLIVREDAKRHKRICRYDTPIAWFFKVIYLFQVIRTGSERFLIDESRVLIVRVQVLLCRLWRKTSRVTNTCLPQGISE